MSQILYDVLDFTSFVGGMAARFNGLKYANVNADLATLATAMASDSTTHDNTINDPGIALRWDVTHSQFMNEIIKLISMAKAGGLKKDQIIAGLNSVAPVANAPAAINVPFISASAVPAIVGTVMTGTGNPADWVNAPSSYTYQWTRDGANIGAATGATYTLIGADVGGHAIGLNTVAVNATGSSPAVASNTIWVP